MFSGLLALPLLQQRVSTYFWNCQTQCHIISLCWSCTVAQSRLFLSTCATISGALPTTPYSPTASFTIFCFWPLAQTVEIWFGSALLNCRWLANQVSVLDFACRGREGGGFIWFRILFPWRQRGTLVYLICGVGRSVFLQCCDRVCAANVCMCSKCVYVQQMCVCAANVCMCSKCV
jgi:hypothetical protein